MGFNSAFKGLMKRSGSRQTTGWTQKNSLPCFIYLLRQDAPNPTVSPYAETKQHDPHNPYLHYGLPL